MLKSIGEDTHNTLGFGSQVSTIFQPESSQEYSKKSWVGNASSPFALACSCQASCQQSGMGNICFRKVLKCFIGVVT